MAKGVYIGVGNVAKKVKKMYIGVDGKARKVKKAYIGVDGVARLFYEKKYTLDLSHTSTNYLHKSKTSRYEGTAEFNGYAVLAGGSKSSGSDSAIDLFNASLTRTTPTTTVNANDSVRCAVVGSKLVAITPSSSSNVNVFDTSFTRTLNTIAIESSYEVLSRLIQLNNNEFYLLGQWATSNKRIQSVNSSLTVTNTSTGSILSSAFRNFVSKTKDYVMVANLSTGKLHYFNASRTFESSPLSTWSLNDHNVEGGPTKKDGSYALFGGGYYGEYGDSNRAYAVSNSLTVTRLDDLAGSRYSLSKMSLGEYCIFGYGYQYYYPNDGGYIDVYDGSFTHTVPKHVTGTYPYGMPDVYVGDYGLWSWNNDSSGNSRSISVPYVALI